MTVTNITSGVSAATISGATTVTITNLPVPLANTEVSHVLTAGLKMLSIRCRGNAKTQFAFVVTESATKFKTISAGSEWSQESLSFTGKTLYIQTNKVTQTIEIMEFS